MHSVSHFDEGSCRFRLGKQPFLASGSNPRNRLAEYVIIPHYWIGSVALKPTLADGWNLTGFDSTIDTKIPETLNALAAGLKAATPGGVTTLGLAEELKEIPRPVGNVRPGLYPMQPDGDTLTIDAEHPVFAAK